ncbi:MAG TPA: cytochrome P450 [Solirubrobacteraceae bacterium]|nr:cytochrome P450 [Solirubrobacteraceae bacterium]
MTSSGTAQGVWDPEAAFAAMATSPDVLLSDVYNELLEQEAVTRVGSPDGMWGIFTYADVVKVAGDYKTFSSVTPRPGAGRVLPLECDPPEHAQYRRMMNPSFAPAKIAEAELDVRPFAAAMLDEMIAAGEADFGATFAYEFPIRALCKFMRIPEDSWTEIRNWHHRLVYEGDQNEPGRPKRDEMVAEFVPYMMAIVGQRRATPGDDVVTAIINGEVDGEPLDDIAIVGLMIALFMAGFTTTTGAIGNLVLRVAHDSELQAFLRANPDRVADAVEESLRLDSTQQTMHRICTTDTELGGQRISAGDYISLHFGSANVDERRWPNAATFDLDRKDKHQHLAFGRGVHKCYGAPLARMEMRVVLEELLARTDSFAISGPMRRLTWPAQKIETLPLSFVPRGS